MPYMPFFAADYALEANHLTDEEHGAYLRLRVLAWTTPGCRLPNDDEWLARRLSRPLDVVRTLYRRVIAELWDSDCNWIWKCSLQRDYERAQRTSSSRSASAKSRWNKEKPPCKSNASKLKLKNKNLEPLTPETPTPQPSEPELPLAPSAPAHSGNRTPSSEPDGFAAFYAAYPKKVDRPKALSAYRTARKSASVEAIAAGLRRWIAGWESERTARKYIPAPAVWLHGQRWCDDAPGQDHSASHPRASPPMDPRLAARLAESQARNAARASAEAAGLTQQDEEYDRHVDALMMEWYNNEQRRSV